jgi:hypothetical protein
VQASSENAKEAPSGRRLVEGLDRTLDWTSMEDLRYDLT